MGNKPSRVDETKPPMPECVRELTDTFRDLLPACNGTTGSPRYCDDCTVMATCPAKKVENYYAK